MPAPTDKDLNLWMILFWAVLAMLIGVLLIYGHHSDVQKGKLVAAKGALSDASARAAAADSAVNETAQAAQRARQQIAQLEADHQAKTRALEASHAEALEQLEAAHADTVASLKSEHGDTVSQLQAQLDAATQAAAEHEAAISELHETNTTMERELEQNKASVTALNERLVEVTEENHELSAKLSADNETIAGLNYELNSANQVEAALRDKLARGADRQERLQTLVDKEEAAILDLQDKLVALTREREALAARADGAAKEAAGEPTQWQAELEKSQALIAELQTELTAAVQEREAVEQQLNDAPAATNTMTVALDDARARIAALEQEASALESQLSERDAALAEARAAAAEALASEDTAALQAKVENLESELTETRSAAEQAAADAAAALEAERATLAEARKQLDAEHRDRLAAADVKLAAAEAKLAQEREALKTQLAAARQAQARDDGADDARIAELTETVSALETRLAETEATAAALETKLATTEQAHAAALADARATGAASAKQIQALYSDAAQLGGQLTGDGILLTLAGDELRFATGTATLPEGDLPSLDRIAEFLKDKPSLTVRVEGHTDSSGSAEINQELSRQRAEAVMQALVARGVAAERISAEGLGEERPIADNETEQGRRANRRVEVYAIRAD